MSRRIRVRTPAPVLALGVLAVAMVALPLVGLAVAMPWGRIPELLGEPIVLDALRLSLLTSLLATVICVVLGVPLAWLLARVPFRGRTVVGAIVMAGMLGLVALTVQRSNGTFSSSSRALVASSAVILSPINPDLVEVHRLSGQVMEWQWARLFSPFINLYAATFLIGGAALSAWRFRRDPTARHRFIGNVFIAVGALLPGIGGTATRFGYTEVLYVTELLGLLLIWTGYRYNVMPGAAGAPPAPTEAAVASGP